MSGYKTYLVAGAMLIYQLLGYVLYGHAPDIQSVLTAAGLAALRNAIK